MKKVFGLFLSLIVLAGLWSCEAELPDEPQKPNPDEPSYLTFVSSGESSVTLVKVGKPFDISLEYSLDGKNWNPYTIGETIYLLEDKLSFRAGEQGNRRLSKGIDDYYQFVFSGEIAARGSILSLLDRSCRKNVIPSYAFFNLFRDCTGLTKAPELPATNLAERCYWGMFSGCTSLNEAPELPAMKLAEECYYCMFDGCTGLTKAPELPATELAESCFEKMFSGCTSLTKAPMLPAMVLAAGCYSNMFNGCTNLTEAPTLPATELASGCYESMFKDCTKLIKAPELPAVNLVENCYGEMFYRCENLSYIMAFFTDKPSEETTCNWVYGVASTGTFVKSKDAMWNVRGDNGIPKGWTVEGDVANPDESLCLTFVSSGESTIALIKKGEPSEITLEYNVDGEGWASYTIGKTVKLADGGELMFRAGEQGNDFFSSDDENYYNFKITGSVAARGNIMSLLDRKCVRNSVPSNVFNGLFKHCRTLTSAPELPATELESDCYNNMFDGCTSLAEAPVLPATELAEGCYRGMFNDCRSLTKAPALPATELAERCYSYMFSFCKSLRNAPALPATKLAEFCYYGMFSGCARLTEAPELPATELALSCYNYMFVLCESLTKAPELPATELAGGCYDSMFKYCNFTKAPALPATELAKWCYSNMFNGCMNLTEAPVLPATELAEFCYYGMFEGCRSLTKAPELPATKLAGNCYFEMFFGCANLKFVKALFTDKPSEETTKDWLSGVSYTGIFVKSKDATWNVRGYSGIPIGWDVVSDAEISDGPQKPNPDEPSYLTFVSSGESIIALIKEGEPSDISLEYSLDGKNWKPYSIGKNIYLLNEGELSFRAGEQGNNYFSNNDEDYYYFKISGRVAAKGNIMSLLDRKCVRNSVSSYAFNRLFFFCTNLTKAPDLPAMELAEHCYSSMFNGCTSLNEAPELPATELAESCYYGMFEGCTSLTKAPELPATELAESCYYGMFEGCTSLTKAPELPATKLADDCYFDMFWQCTSLTKAPELPATELAEHCYSGMFAGCTSLTKTPALPAMKLTDECYNAMFAGCTSLTKAPALPATKLAKWCYPNMFNGCTSLNEAPELPATDLDYDCYERMFSGCTSLTKAPELPATELAWACYQEMFSGCTSLIKAPALPATELASYCYWQMFKGCTSLNYVKALFTDKPSLETTENWLSGVSYTGTFVKSQYATWDVRGYSGIPYGWTVESDAGTSDDPQKPNPDEPSYLMFVSSGESTIALIKEGEPFEITLEYSLNGTSWKPYTIGKTVKLADGEKLMFRAWEQGNDFFSSNDKNYYNFKITGSVAARGNIMSLLDKSCQKNTVPSNAFNSLFKYCRTLTSAPALPAMKLASGCYFSMFAGCTSLTKTPELPATELAEWCYFSMFWGCTSLTKAPDLPATELAEHCYSWMFKGCTSLMNAPALPVTELAPGCYSNMFHGCTNLTKAPELPATELAPDCYTAMFAGCTSLKKAPVLPATKLVAICYSGLFQGCNSLNYVKALFTDEPSVETTENWLSSVSSTGTFVKSQYATWDVRGDDGIPEGWTVESDAGTSDDSQKPNPDEPSCLTFVSSGESTIALIKEGDPFEITLEYSVDGKSWIPYTIGKTLELFDREKLMFRAGEQGNAFFSLNASRYYHFKISGSVAARGNIMSLLDRKCERNSVPIHAFNSLFKYCEALTSAPVLPATELSENCYYCMFRGCTSLTKAPALPAKVMAKVCYSGMFWGCTSLMKAPALPAMELAEYCYGGMFRDCTSLTEAPALPATELASMCYGSMFLGCTSLTEAPALPARELAKRCYARMFFGCTNLNYVKALFTDEPSVETTENWLSGVSHTGTFVKSKDATWDVMGVSGVPEGWTVITE